MLSSSQSNSQVFPLPNNPEAERAILGAVIVNAENFASFQSVSPTCFFVPEHRVIARGILALHEKGKPIDLLLLNDELNRTGTLESAGGSSYIAKLADGLPRILNAGFYAKIVREKSFLRDLAYRAFEIQRLALEPKTDVEQLERKWRDLNSTLPQIDRRRLKAITANELLRLDVAPRETILAPILPTQGLGMLYSKRGLGKTNLALGMAYATASGGKCLRWTAPKARRVLFVDGELPLSTLKERLVSVTTGMPTLSEPDMLRLITPDLQEGPFPDLSTREGQTLIEGELKGVELVILDNLSALCRTGKENEGESWLPVQEWALWLRQRGISVLFVHHAGKAGAQRGTSRREDLLDVVIGLRHPTDYSPAEGLRCEVHFEKCRGFYGEDARPFEVRMETDPAGTALWTMRDLDAAVETRALALFTEGLSVRDVAEELGISKSRAGRIKKRGGATNGAQ
jgi:hypothetical protein